jgi:hypothetical protein
MRLANSFAPFCPPDPTCSFCARPSVQRVALALDRAGWPEIVGNIGGDDTVFVATDSANHQKILAARLERIVAR